MLKLIMQDDVYEERESDPRQIINTGEICQHFRSVSYRKLYGNILHLLHKTNKKPVSISCSGNVF